MADDSAQNQSFWKGIAAGFLAGITVAAALRCTPLEKFISRFTTVEGKLDSKLPAIPENLVSRTEPLPVASGFASSNRQVESTQTGGPALVDRRGEKDGEERVDHIDLSQPHRRYPRSFEMGSAG
jgi:hypothetical protein